MNKHLIFLFHQSTLKKYTKREKLQTEITIKKKLIVQQEDDFKH